MTKNISVITLDGPSGSGKGTISQKLASKLGWHFLDSGALYRVLAFAVLKDKIKIDNAKAIETKAKNLDISFEADDIGGAPIIIYEGNDITSAIRSEECANIASKIAVSVEVRAALLECQKQFRMEPGLIADGRDMGTVVFPDAKLKFFLTASLDERARRRYQQLKTKGMKVTLEQILDDLTERDVRDRERAVAPMKPAKDAIVIDTSIMDINDVFLKVLAEVDAVSA